MSALAPVPLPFQSALVCPDDRAPLTAHSPSELICSHCRRVFGSDGGILRMLPQRPAATAEELADTAEERAQRDAEAEQYDSLLGLRLLTLLELPVTLQPLQIRSEDRVLEVGCGTGRFTLPVSSRCRELIAVDHSLESLRVLARKLPGSSRQSVLLVQGDATCLPIRTDWATRALSCQMLEHLPSDEMRAQAISELARCLNAGGRFALSGYWFAPGLKWLLAREGKHSGKIYFHRFERQELRQLLEPHFRLDRLTGRLIYILLAHGIRRAGVPG